MMAASWPSQFKGSDIIPVPLRDNGLPEHNWRPEKTKSSQWIFFAPLEAHVSPHFRDIFGQYTAKRPDVGIFYADEVEQSATRKPKLILKPAFNFPLLIADDYIGSPAIVRADVFEDLGGLDLEFGDASVYDLVLRAAHNGYSIERIPEVFVAHTGERPRSSPGQRKQAIEEHMRMRENIEILPGLTSSSWQMRRRFSKYPAVTLVIPTRQSLQADPTSANSNKPHIINFLESLRVTNWPSDLLKVVIGDDLPDGAIYSDLQCPFDIRRIVTDRVAGVPFNYAAKMNRLWREANSEFVVLMNDDIVIETPDWLEALMTFAMDEDVGGVGARLLYGNGRLQHAGVAGGLFGACAHAWLGLPADAPTYQDWALVHREWSMVTGAVFATRRSVLEAVNGFDECFSLEFNDIDLCLRLRVLGYRIVYTPFAELIHFEKSSRGEALPPGSDVALFMRRWADFLDADPAFHPGFERRSFELKPVSRTGEWYNDIRSQRKTPWRGFLKKFSRRRADVI